jgi:2-oxo-3-hexenedioate decarboxylase
VRLDEAATELFARETERRAGQPLTASGWADLTIDDAYRVQDLVLDRRLARGERLVGVKLGLTSVAKQRRMGVSAPFVAWLTDAMLLAPEAPVPVSSFIHPRVEPELAFTIAERLGGAAVSAVQALAAVASVHAAVEVIDSRFRDFSFTAADVIADNASTAAVIVDPTPFDAAGRDLALQSVIVEAGGRVLDSATGAAILGHPAEALAFAARVLDRRGLAIEPGWIVLTGAMTDAVPLSDHRSLTFDFDRLGSIHVRGESHAAG